MCGKQDHFGRDSQSKSDERRSTCCIKDEEAAMDALIAHVVIDRVTDTNKQDNNNGCKEVEAILILFSPYPDPKQARDIPITHSTRLKIYPDSGATICLGGLKHLWHMGLSERNLVLQEKSAHCWRIFFSVSRLAAYYIQNWGQIYEAGAIHMQRGTGNILQ